MEGNVAIVSELLNGKKNYEKWSIQMRAYLSGRDLWDVVGSDENPGDEASSSSKRKNDLALHAILISCRTKAFSFIKNMSSARVAWAALLAQYGEKDEEDDGHLKLKSESENESESESESQSEKIRKKTDKPKSDRKGEGNGSRKTTPEKIGTKAKREEQNNVDIRPYWTLFNAVKHGDWEEAKAFLDEHPEAIRARIPYSGKNVLHVAVSEGHLHIVEKLTEQMTVPDLEMRRVDGFTALAAAIEIGSLPIAKCLIAKHRKLVSLTHPEGLPVRHAIVSGRRNMVPYLYSVTPIENLKLLDNGIHCAALLSQCIYSKHYDIALSLLDHAPELAITSDDPGKSPLWALATSKLFTDPESSLKFWQLWIYHFIQIPTRVTSHISVDIQNVEDNRSDKEDNDVDKGFDALRSAGKLCSSLMRRLVSIPLQILDVKNVYELKVVHAQTREILRRVCKVIAGTSDRMVLQNAGLSSAMIQAAYHGNKEFITGMAKANHELVWGPYISRKVIEVGIQRRQPNIFSLVYGLRDKVALASYRDENRSNMLHKAAIIAPPRLLNRIPGAALQMQRELQWFKEVETIVSPAATIATTDAHPGSTEKKKEYLTPREIFTESHKELVIAGEKWMKDTSSSSTVVGALIVTVTFAAAFTFPGGYDQSNGIPMFIDKILFKVFTIANALALSASTSSVLTFLGILTSRYAEEDFLTSLPKKLIIGLSTLFLSIAAMLTAFCAGLSVMFKYKLWIVIPSACLAGIPVLLFIAIQFPLLVDIFMSSYGPSIFYKNAERWI